MGDTTHEDGVPESSVLPATPSAPGGGVRHTEFLLRKAHTGPAAASTAAQTTISLKEKFVNIYEQLFFQGLEACQGSPTFWEELFLLRVNSAFLERCVILTGEEQLLQMKETLQAIFANACRCLHDHVRIRVAHALETICILLRCLFRKKFSSFGVSALAVLCPADSAREQIGELLTTLNAILLDSEGSYPEPFRRLALACLVILATATERVADNSFLAYFMDVDLFDTIMLLLRGGHDSPLGTEAMFLLAILLSYGADHSDGNDDDDDEGGAHGPETGAWGTGNLYHARLAAAPADLQAVLAKALQTRNGLYHELITDPKHNPTILSRMTGFLSGWFATPTEDPYAKISAYQTGAVLLNAYHLVRVTFQRRLDGAVAAKSTFEDEEDDDDGGDNGDDDEDVEDKAKGEERAVDPKPTSGANGGDVPQQEEAPGLLAEAAAVAAIKAAEAEEAHKDNKAAVDRSAAQSAGGEGKAPAAVPGTTPAPTPTPQQEMMVQLLGFSAYLLPEMRDARQREYGQLCLHSLLRLTADPATNRALHDPANAAAIPVYRRTKTVRNVVVKTQPLACALIDIMVCTMRGNLKRRLPAEVFCPCLDIIRRLVVFQKNEGVRLAYNWQELWSCLLSLIRVICTETRSLYKDGQSTSIELHGSMDDMSSSSDAVTLAEGAEGDAPSEILVVAKQVVLLLNLFITFGPRIFPSTQLAAGPVSPPSIPRSRSSSVSSSAATPAAAPASSSSAAFAPTATVSAPVPTTVAEAASAPMSRSVGYGSFSAAAQPLYRTQPLVDIPAYFQLIYEIIHNSALLRAFVEWAALHDTTTMHCLDNVSNIIMHYTAKVDEWYAEHPEQTLEAEQVLIIIRQHYPTLSLASTSELASSERVAPLLETNEQVERVNKLVKALVADYRAGITISPVPENMLTTTHSSSSSS